MNTINPNTYPGATRIDSRDSHDTQQNLSDIYTLDREILEHSETSRKLVELGLGCINEVTQRYGTPEHPKWALGSYEQNVLMAYHNAGSDGHSSVGIGGAGVPRNVLVIANAVNTAAHSEVYDPLARAVAFYAATAHDIVQLCGRSLLSEGQVDQTRGDERLSAEYARDLYLERGGTSEIAQRIYDGVMATAFNPHTGSQNVASYDRADTAAIQKALDQELVAVADLFSPTTSRGPLGAFEYCIESLSSSQKGYIIQRRLEAQNISLDTMSSLYAVLTFIDNDTQLKEALNSIMSSQSVFFKEVISYSDKTIRMKCGKGIDELFPGRISNGNILQSLSEELLADKSAVEVWKMVCRINDQDSV